MAFDSHGYALAFEGAGRDDVAGSKQTHMGGYVEQVPAQSANGWKKRTLTQSKMVT